MNSPGESNLRASSPEEDKNQSPPVLGKSRLKEVSISQQPPERYPPKIREQARRRASCRISRNVARRIRVFPLLLLVMKFAIRSRCFAGPVTRGSTF